MQLSTDLIPSQRAYCCREMANNWPPSPFRARKAKKSSDVAFRVWKGPHCVNRMLHMTHTHTPRTRGKLRLQEKPLSAYTLRVLQVIRCVDTASEYEQEKQQAQSTGILILFVCTAELADVLKHHPFIHGTSWYLKAQDTQGH